MPTALERAAAAAYPNSGAFERRIHLIHRPAVLVRTRIVLIDDKKTNGASTRALEFTSRHLALEIGHIMTMGTGVVLFVIGAILAFAIKVQTALISLSTAGYILMAAGAVVFVIGLALTLRGRRSVVTTASEAAGATRTTSRTTDSTEL